MRRKSAAKRFVICAKNDGYPASLEVRKVYQTLPDLAARNHGLIRVIDESGEDYLYPDSFFAPIELPSALKKAFAVAS
jgi:hypothetical protein